jgi:hypothetical protein
MRGRELLEAMRKKAKEEETPAGFLRLWLCPDTMDLETGKGRSARDELRRLAGECYK